MGPNETNSARRIARRPDLRHWRWVATGLIHELVTDAARAGRIEVLRNRHDRRIRQVRLTASGRSHLAGIRAAEAGYVITTLNGLDTRELRAAADVVRKVRHGLLRYRDMHERR